MEETGKTEQGGGREDGMQGRQHTPQDDADLGRCGMMTGDPGKVISVPGLDRCEESSLTSSDSHVPLTDHDFYGRHEQLHQTELKVMAGAPRQEKTDLPKPWPQMATDRHRLAPRPNVPLGVLSKDGPRLTTAVGPECVLLEVLQGEQTEEEIEMEQEEVLDEKTAEDGQGPVKIMAKELPLCTGPEMYKMKIEQNGECFISATSTEKKLKNKEQAGLSLKLENKEQAGVSLKLENKEQAGLSLKLENKELAGVSLKLENKEQAGVSLKLENKEQAGLSLKLENEENKEQCNLKLANVDNKLLEGLDALPISDKLKIQIRQLTCSEGVDVANKLLSEFLQLWKNMDKVISSTTETLGPGISGKQKEDIKGLLRTLSVTEAKGKQVEEMERYLTEVWTDEKKGAMEDLKTLMIGAWQGEESKAKWDAVEMTCDFSRQETLPSMMLMHIYTCLQQDPPVSPHYKATYSAGDHGFLLDSVREGETIKDLSTDDEDKDGKNAKNLSSTNYYENNGEKTITHLFTDCGEGKADKESMSLKADFTCQQHLSELSVTDEQGRMPVENSFYFSTYFSPSTLGLSGATEHANLTGRDLRIILSLMRKFVGQVGYEPKTEWQTMDKQIGKDTQKEKGDAGRKENPKEQPEVGEAHVKADLEEDSEITGVEVREKSDFEEQEKSLEHDLNKVTVIEKCDFEKLEKTQKNEDTDTEPSPGKEQSHPVRSESTATTAKNKISLSVISGSTAHICPNPAENELPAMKTKKKRKKTKGTKKQEKTSHRQRNERTFSQKEKGHQLVRRKRKKGKSRACDRKKGKSPACDRKKGKGQTCDIKNGKSRACDRKKGKGQTCDRKKGEGQTCDRKKGEGQTCDRKKGEGQTCDRKKGKSQTCDRKKGKGQTCDRKKGEGQTCDMHEVQKTLRSGQHCTQQRTAADRGVTSSSERRQQSPVKQLQSKVDMNQSQHSAAVNHPQHLAKLPVKYVSKDDGKQPSVSQAETRQKPVESRRQHRARKKSTLQPEGRPQFPMESENNWPRLASVERSGICCQDKLQRLLSTDGVQHPPPFWMNNQKIGHGVRGDNEKPRRVERGDNQKVGRVKRADVQKGLVERGDYQKTSRGEKGYNHKDGRVEKRYDQKDIRGEKGDNQKAGRGEKGDNQKAGRGGWQGEFGGVMMVLMTSDAHQGTPGGGTQSGSSSHSSSQGGSSGAHDWGGARPKTTRNGGGSGSGGDGDGGDRRPPKRNVPSSLPLAADIPTDPKAQRTGTVRKHRRKKQHGAISNEQLCHCLGQAGQGMDTLQQSSGIEELNRCLMLCLHDTQCVTSPTLDDLACCTCAILHSLLSHFSSAAHGDACPMCLQLFTLVHFHVLQCHAGWRKEEEEESLPNVCLRMRQARLFVDCDANTSTTGKVWVKVRKYLSAALGPVLLLDLEVESEAVTSADLDTQTSGPGEDLHSQGQEPSSGHHPENAVFTSAGAGDASPQSGASSAKQIPQGAQTSADLPVGHAAVMPKGAASSGVRRRPSMRVIPQKTIPEEPGSPHPSPTPPSSPAKESSQNQDSGTGSVQVTLPVTFPRRAETPEDSDDYMVYIRRLQQQLSQQPPSRQVNTDPYATTKTYGMGGTISMPEPRDRLVVVDQNLSVEMRPTGVPGIGEVVYGTRQQLLLVARNWRQERDECKVTQFCRYQHREEGVILHAFRKELKILHTRYQKHYQWERLVHLGNGVTGKCHLCIDRTSNFKFCCKKVHILHYEDHELDIWSELNHPSIVRFYGAIRHGEKIYLFAEFIDGGSLAAMIKEQWLVGRRLSHWTALNYFRQLLKVLDYLQNMGVLHEDIKADNLLLRDGTTEIVLADFGVAQQIPHDHTPPNRVPTGSPAHWSPEKAASEGHGFTADLWASACVLIHMLSGSPPWISRFPDASILNYIIWSRPPPMDDVPSDVKESVRDLLSCCLVKDQAIRPLARQILNHPAFSLLDQAGSLFSIAQHAQPSVHASTTTTNNNNTIPAPAPAPLNVAPCQEVTAPCQPVQTAPQVPTTHQQHSQQQQAAAYQTRPSSYQAGQGTQQSEQAVRPPGQGTQQSEQAVQQPGQGTQQSEQAVQPPGQGTQQSEQAVQPPGQGTQQSEQAVQQPGQGTQQSEQAVRPPGQGTQQSEPVLSQPGQASSSHLEEASHQAHQVLAFPQTGAGMSEMGSPPVCTPVASMLEPRPVVRVVEIPRRTSTSLAAPSQPGDRSGPLSLPECLPLGNEPSCHDQPSHPTSGLPPVHRKSDPGLSTPFSTQEGQSTSTQGRESTPPTGLSLDAKDSWLSFQPELWPDIPSPVLTLASQASSLVYSPLVQSSVAMPTTAMAVSSSTGPVDTSGRPVVTTTHVTADQLTTTSVQHTRPTVLRSTLSVPDPFSQSQHGDQPGDQDSLSSYGTSMAHGETGGMYQAPAYAVMSSSLSVSSGDQNPVSMTTSGKPPLAPCPVPITRMPLIKSAGGGKQVFTVVPQRHGQTAVSTPPHTAELRPGCIAGNDALPTAIVPSGDLTTTVSPASIHSGPISSSYVSTSPALPPGEHATQAVSQWTTLPQQTNPGSSPHASVLYPALPDLSAEDFQISAGRRGVAQMPSHLSIIPEVMEQESMSPCTQTGGSLGSGEGTVWNYIQDQFTAPPDGGDQLVNSLQAENRPKLELYAPAALAGEESGRQESLHLYGTLLPRFELLQSSLSDSSTLRSGRITTSLGDSSLRSHFQIQGPALSAVSQQISSGDPPISQDEPDIPSALVQPHSQGQNHSEAVRTTGQTKKETAPTPLTRASSDEDRISSGDLYCSGPSGDPGFEEVHQYRQQHQHVPSQSSSDSRQYRQQQTASPPSLQEAYQHRQHQQNAPPQSPPFHQQSQTPAAASKSMSRKPNLRLNVAKFVTSMPQGSQGQSEGQGMSQPCAMPETGPSSHLQGDDPFLLLPGVSPLTASPLSTTMPSSASAPSSSTPRHTEVRSRSRNESGSSASTPKSSTYDRQEQEWTTLQLQTPGFESTWFEDPMAASGSEQSSTYNLSLQYEFGETTIPDQEENNLLSMLQEGISNEHLGGQRLVFENQQGEFLFDMRVLGKNKGWKELAVTFRGKIYSAGFQHFTLMQVDGTPVDFFSIYDSAITRVKVIHVSAEGLDLYSVCWCENHIAY